MVFTTSHLMNNKTLILIIKRNPSNLTWHSNIIVPYFIIMIVSYTRVATPPIVAQSSFQHNSNTLRCTSLLACSINHYMWQPDCLPTRPSRNAGKKVWTSSSISSSHKKQWISQSTPRYANMHFIGRHPPYKSNDDALFAELALSIFLSN
jgi:hypothetical protein